MHTNSPKVYILSIFVLLSGALSVMAQDRRYFDLQNNEQIRNHFSNRVVRIWNIVYFFQSDGFAIVSHGSSPEYQVKWNIIDSKICMERKEEKRFCSLIYKDRTSNRLIWPASSPKEEDLVIYAAGSGRKAFKRSVENLQEEIANSPRNMTAQQRTFLEEARRPKLEAERKAKEEIENIPERKLRDTYSLYLFVKSCFDARKSYSAVYISDDEMQTARQAAKQIETRQKERQASLDFNLIWKETSDKFAEQRDPIGFRAEMFRSTSVREDDFTPARRACQVTLQTLLDEGKKNGLANPTMKKDF